MRDLNRVSLTLLAAFFGPAGLGSMVIGLLYVLDDATDADQIDSWIGIRDAYSWWVLGALFLIVYLLADIASNLPDRRPAKTVKDIDPV